MGIGPFFGRDDELRRLQAHLGAVISGEARLLSVRGRRQAGKSRLVTEFVRRSGLPQLFVTGSRQPSIDRDLASFVEDVRLGCTLPGADLLAGDAFTSWEQALRSVFAALPVAAPAVVVIDELPWLLESDPGIDGTLQKLWDRLFESRRVLMILIGSDLSVMEMLTSHDRPLFGRAREMVVSPFSVGDSARLLGIGTDRASDAFDAQLVTGGYPRLLQALARHGDLGAFVHAQLMDSNSEIVVTGQRMLTAEFPRDLRAAEVLRTIGTGERSFSAVAGRVGLAASVLSRTLHMLIEKRVIVAELPVSTAASKIARYRVADPYLRFWLRFVEPGAPDIERGRPDLARARLDGAWSSYRGRAVEPLVREALVRLAAGDPALGGAETVGAWWPRNNVPEVDLIGARPAGAPKEITFVGSVKWRDQEPFGQADLDDLVNVRPYVPGASHAAPIAVTRTTCTARGVEVYDPARLLSAW